jgi:hypothetical protein
MTHKQHLKLESCVDAGYSSFKRLEKAGITYNQRTTARCTEEQLTQGGFATWEQFLPLILFWNFYCQEWIFGSFGSFFVARGVVAIGRIVWAAARIWEVVLFIVLVFY